MKTQIEIREEEAKMLERELKENNGILKYIFTFGDTEKHVHIKENML